MNHCEEIRKIHNLDILLCIVNSSNLHVSLLIKKFVLKQSSVAESLPFFLSKSQRKRNTLRKIP